MSSDDPVIVGVGLMTAVGLSARETAAAVRSSASRFTESAFLDVRGLPFTVAEVPDKGLPKLVDGIRPVEGLTTRELRLARLGTQPLLECLAVVPPSRDRPTLVLALPEMQLARPLDGARLLALLASQTDGAIDPEKSVAVDAGRAGGLLALSRAADMVRSGARRFVVAGGLDTYRDPYVLGNLDKERRVKSETNTDGFIPGEAGAFIALTSAATAAAAGLVSLARITRAGQSEELGHLYSTEPYRGDGLADAIRSLTRAGAAAEPFGDVWSSMNGESHWGKEWGVTFLRNRAAFAEDHGIHHPADSVGDTGAACGPLMVALAALGIRGDYHRSPALIYCSSDRGARAALAVSRA